MRIAVLPRDVASRIITSSLTRAVWAANLANLVFGALLLVDYLSTRGLLAALPVPLTVILGMIPLALLAAWRDSIRFTVAFLVIGIAGSLVYQLALLAADPQIVADGVVVLNRLAVSLVLVGVSGRTAITPVAWAAAGFALAMASMFTASRIAQVSFEPGWAGAVFLGLVALCHATLSLVQAEQRRRIPDFESLEQEMGSLTEQERLRLRVNAAVHDTLLNDLTIVMNAPDELDERTASRLLDDLQSLERGEWVAARDALADAGDADLRNRLLMIISDLQWRGLTVNLTGERASTTRIAPAAAAAAVDAVRAALENVLRHSGQTEADLELTFGQHEATIIVSDHGAGFDPDAVPADRLGLRDSVVGRIREVGGSARLWSSPGGGTSIVMRVPFATGASA